MEKVQEEISEATVQYSDTELPKFENWLKSPNKAVRMAAAEGLLQSGLQSGAVLLRDAARAATDPEEIQEYSRGAEILELPPATALLAQAREKAKASGKERRPLRRFNLNERRADQLGGSVPEEIPLPSQPEEQIVPAPPADPE